MLEPRSTPMQPWTAFRRRLARHLRYAGLFVAASLLIGTLGFWLLADEAPIDAFLNSAMLLGGMGPVGEIRHTGGKLFAAFFALYAGLAFLVVATLLVTPVFHRLLHLFHIEEERERRDRSQD